MIHDSLLRRVKISDNAVRKFVLSRVSSDMHNFNYQYNNASYWLLNIFALYSLIYCVNALLA